MWRVGSRVERRNHASGTRLLTALVIVGYFLLRIIEWFGSLPMVTWGDSHSYLPGAGTGIPADFVLGFQKLSFSGIDVIRPWTVVLPYSLMPTMAARGVLQTLVSCLAFLFLAAVIYRLCSNRRLGQLLALAVLTFSLLPEVAAWDNRIGRESITISLTAALIAAALVALQTASMASLVFVFGAGTLLALTRPTSMLLSAPLMLFVLIRFLRPKLLNFRSAEEGVIRRTFTILLALALFVIALAYPFQYSKNLDAGWVRWYGQSMSETQFGYLVSDFNPDARTLIDALGEVAPACITKSLPVDTSQSLGKPFYLPSELRSKCPDYLEWVQTEWPGFFSRFLKTHPNYDSRQILNGFASAMSPHEYQDVLSVLPQTLHSVMLPSGAMARFDPLLGYGVALLLLMMLRHLCRTFGRGWQRVFPNGTMWITLLVIAGGIAGITVNLLILPTHFEDIQRINLASSLSIRLTVILAVITLLWQSWANRATLERPGADAYESNNGYSSN